MENSTKKIRAEGYPSQPAPLAKMKKHKGTKTLKSRRVPFSRDSKFCRKFIRSQGYPPKLRALKDFDEEPTNLAIRCIRSF